MQLGCGQVERGAKVDRVLSSGRVKTAAVKGITVCCGRAVLILGNITGLKGERIEDLVGTMTKKYLLSPLFYSLTLIIRLSDSSM